MVDVKQALEAAIAYCREHFAPQHTPRFEEVESGQYRKRDVWEITLSWPQPQGWDRVKLTREYKIFTVDKVTGKVLRVKMHELAVH